MINQSTNSKSKRLYHFLCIKLITFCITSTRTKYAHLNDIVILYRYKHIDRTNWKCLKYWLINRLCKRAVQFQAKFKQAHLQETNFRGGFRTTCVKLFNCRAKLFHGIHHEPVIPFYILAVGKVLIVHCQIFLYSFHINGLQLFGVFSGISLKQKIQVKITRRIKC